MQRRTRKQMDQLWSKGNKAAREVSKKATKVAQQVGDYVSDRAEELRDNAEDFTDELRKRVRPRTSFASQLGNFAAGLGLGFGAALLFAPRSGRQVRAEIAQATSGAVDSFARGYNRGRREGNERRAAEV